MKKAIIAIALVVLLALGLALSQEESHEHEAHQDGHDHLAVFDKNIQLTFEMLNDEGQGDEPMAIVTAIPEYKLVARFEHDEEEADVLVTGAAGPRNDGRILVLMEVQVSLADPEGESEMAVECGVLLEPGKGREVATWGDRKLIVHAAYTD